MSKRKRKIDSLADMLARSAAKLVREKLKSASTPEEADHIAASTMESFRAALPAAIEKYAERTADLFDRKSASRLRRRRRYRRGFERRLQTTWGDGLDRLETLVAFYTEFGEEYCSDGLSLELARTSPVFQSLVELHARGARIANEILCLLNGGFADGAHARWRTLYELSVVARFIAQHGDETADRYLRHNAVRAAKAANRFNANAVAIGWQPEAQDVIDTLEKGSATLLAEFGTTFAKDLGWAAKALDMKQPRFGDLEADIGFGHWHTFYEWASGGVHAGAGALNPMGAPLHGVQYLLVGPSNAALVDPAQFTALTLVQILRSLFLSRPQMDYQASIAVFDVLVKRCQNALCEANRLVEERSSQGA